MGPPGGRAVPGCGSQRLLRALLLRLHPAGRCPNSSSLFQPLAAVVAVAIPVRVKAAFSSFDIPNRWDPRTKQQPTGLIAYPAAQGRAVRFPYGSN